MRFPRILAATLLASSAALLFAACGDDHDHFEVRGDHRDYCAEYASCGTCTPVEGCGWCAYEDGSGSCSSEPDRCRGSSFHWNWEPAGCSTPADAGPVTDTAPVIDAPPADASDAVEPTDGPASRDSISNLPDDSATTDAAETTPDAPAETAKTCTAPSGATLACVQTVGGSLCASGEYTLACHADEGGTPVPAASYGCKTVPTGSPSTTFYCCPCPSS